MTSPPPELSREPLRAAERLLAARFGGRVRIAASAPASDRPTVYRARLEGRGAPDTAIVKVPRLKPGRPYDPKDLSFWSPAWGLTADWAGLEFLDQRQERLGGPRVSPRFYGGDLRRGVIVMEDLGAAASLGDVLLGGDAAAAESALEAYGRALGRMHAISAAEPWEYEDLLMSFRPRERPRVTEDRLLRDQIAKLPETFDELEFEWTPRLVDDVQQVAASMLSPGPFDVLTHSDACPDNNSLVDGRMVLLDFEDAAYRSAFVDAAYLRPPFPECASCNNLPDHAVARFESAYRLELVKTVPEAEDDALFETHIMEGFAYWLIRLANRLLPMALRLEQVWGIATYRQRLLHAFEEFARRASRTGRLEALGAFAYLMGQKMRLRWPEVQDMPLYPAFR